MFTGKVEKAGKFHPTYLINGNSKLALRLNDSTRYVETAFDNVVGKTIEVVGESNGFTIFVESWRVV